MNDAGRALGLAEPMSASGSIGMMPGSGAVPYTPELAGGGYLPTQLTHDLYESRGDPTSSWPVSQPVAPPPTTADPIVAPTGPGRRPGRRRRRSRGGGWRAAALALLLVAGAAAGVTLGLTRGHNTPAASGGGTATAGGSTAPGSATASAASVALPKVAGTIPVGQTPSYIQVAPNGKFAYVANPGANAINVLSTATGKVSKSIPIPQGPPQFVSFSPDSKTAYVSVYTTNGRVHLLAFIDTATGTVTATVPVDNHTPGPSAASPDGRFVYVPNHNTALTGTGENVVDVIDTASKTLVGDVATPANPHWVVFSKNGRFYTTDHMSATVTVLNAEHQRHYREHHGRRDPAQRSPLARRQPPGGHQLRR